MLMVIKSINLISNINSKTCIRIFLKFLLRYICSLKHVQNLKYHLEIFLMVFLKKYHPILWSVL